MVAVSVMIEEQDGLMWPRWKRLVSDVELILKFGTIPVKQPRP